LIKPTSGSVNSSTMKLFYKKSSSA